MNRCFHAGGRKDVPLDVAVVILATDRLDDPPQQHEAVIGVGVLPVGAGVGSARAEKRHIVRQRLHPDPFGLIFGREDVARAACVRKQLPDRHRFGEHGVGIVLEVGPDRRIERDPAFLDQLQRTDGREHLVGGPDPKLRLHRHRCLGGAVGEARSAPVDHLAVTRDDDGPGEAVGGDIPRQVVSHHPVQFGARQARDRELRGPIDDTQAGTDDLHRVGRVDRHLFLPECVTAAPHKRARGRDRAWRGLPG